MKPAKPRNHVALALMKRGASGAHVKANKARRSAAKRLLIKELRKPSDKFSDGFLFAIWKSDNLKTITGVGLFASIDLGVVGPDRAHFAG